MLYLLISNNATIYVQIFKVTYRPYGRGAFCYILVPHMYVYAHVTIINETIYLSMYMLCIL